MKNLLIAGLAIFSVLLFGCVLRGLVRQKRSGGSWAFLVPITAWHEVWSEAVASIVETLAVEGYSLSEYSKIRLRFGDFCKTEGSLEFFGKTKPTQAHRLTVIFEAVDEGMRINILGTLGDNRAQEFLYCFLGLQDVDTGKPMALVVKTLERYVKDVRSPGRPA